MARTRTGELHAVQCKLYAEDYRLQKSDIDSFFTASGKKSFSHRIIVSTTNDWSIHAEEALRDQQPPVTKIDLHDLEVSQIDWRRYQPKKEPKLKPRKTPRPHQISAVKAVKAGLKTADRGKLIMACGTGKTFTTLKIAEELALEWVRHLTSLPVLKEMSEVTGLLPAVRVLLDRAPYNTDPHYRIFSKAIEIGRPLPRVAFWGTIEAELIRAFGNIWSELKENPRCSVRSTVRQYLEPLAERYDEKIYRYSFKP